MPIDPNLTLHHIGYAVHSIPVAAETYCRTFGYTEATQIIHDPLQTALVQFLSLTGEPAFLELIAPDSPTSKLTQTAQKRPGLHHLCYTCGPIQQAIAHLRENGMLLFSDPKPATAFAGRPICWLMGKEGLLIELVERRHPTDPCTPRA